MPRNLISTFGLIFFLTQALLSQHTVNNIEGYFLKPAFVTGLENHFNIIIEKNKDSIVTRKWIFNDAKRLVKELDFRENRISSSMDGQNFSSSINFKEFNYRYDRKGKPTEVVQLIVQDVDTLKTIRRIDYTTENLVKESYILNMDNLMSKEISELTYSHGKLTDSVIFISIGRVNNFYSEWISKTVFNYDEDDKLIKEINYFKSNFFPLSEGQEPMKNKLNYIREYDYDILGRIQTIKEYHYEESGTSKVEQIVNYLYEGTTSKIIGLKFPKLNGSDYENLVLKLEYKDNGLLKQIITDYSNIYYEYTISE